MSERTPEEARPARRQSTFLSGREILTRASELLLDARSALRRAPSGDPRSEMFCNSVESLLADLAATIGHFEADAPDAVLEAWAQYTVELPAVLAPRSPTGDPEQAIPWARSLARGLTTLFEGMAASANNEGLQEIYGNLANLVHTYERRIAALEHDLHDL